MRRDIDKEKACVLIGMNVLFPNGYYGQEELEELFVEQYNIAGFDGTRIALLEEYAPVITFYGPLRFYYTQSTLYLQVYVYDQKKRYRIPYTKHILVIYKLKGVTLGHAMVLSASALLPFLASKTFDVVNLVVPKGNILIDSKEIVV